MWYFFDDLKVLLLDLHVDDILFDRLLSSGGWRFPLHCHALVINLNDIRRRLLRLGTSRRKNWIWLAVHFKLPCQLVSCSLDRHACTMKAEGEQDLLPQQAVEVRSKNCFRQRESMSNMQEAIHVRVWKGAHKLLVGAIRSIALEDLELLPFLLHVYLDLLKQISPGRALLAVSCHGLLAGPQRCCTRSSYGKQPSAAKQLDC
mmetsp:Transcript_26516/g.49840  ORF Transcript_26516/g.49840 Transcript_26516/m.49840 type:complete len:203 (-) Transcript_26516:30-638(-)